MLKQERTEFLRLAAAIALVAGGLPIATAQTTAPSPVRQALEPFVEGGSLAGAVAVYSRNGEILCRESIGYRDLESRTAMTEDCLFWIASMTKPITAIGVMMLQEEGKLHVDDPVEKHLPEFRGQLLQQERSAERTVLVKPRRPVTIRDLLTHTSGLVSQSPLDGNALDVLSLREAVISYGLSPLLFQPGSKWSYCNPGINTLGRLIEVASGEEYSAFLQQRLFTPLGMADTTFWPTEAQLARLATSYDQKAGGPLTRTTIRYLSEPYSNQKRAPLAAGGLFSTAGDLIKLYTMLLNGGESAGKRYLQAETLARMTMDHAGGLKAGFTDGMGMGLGFQVVREPTGVTAMLSPGTYGHGGAHGTQGWIDPEKKAIYILLIQRAGLPNGDASPMRLAFQKAAVKLPGQVTP
ncbi:MAG: beta-lactamase family protein [Verrucomicrobiales bacterium]|nr:beta-lactamase family protein [Verrucomicrobiales bacterium]